jgi:hypothetical protein
MGLPEWNVWNIHKFRLGEPNPDCQYLFRPYGIRICDPSTRDEPEFKGLRPRRSGRWVAWQFPHRLSDEANGRHPSERPSRRYTVEEPGSSWEEVGMRTHSNSRDGY